MAVDYPLVLYDCHFDGLSWREEAEEATHVLSALQQHWTQSAVKTHVLRGMLQGLEARGERSDAFLLLHHSHLITIQRSLPSAGGASANVCLLVEGSRQKNYRPLLERPCCESLESRIEHFVKRGRLERDGGEDGGEMIHRGKRSKHSPVSVSEPVASEVSNH